MFTDELCRAILAKQSILLVGLDPQWSNLPPQLREAPPREALSIFGRSIIDATADYAVAVKPNLAFFERFGSAGLAAFEDIAIYAHEKELLVVADGKRCDGGDTADAYAEAYLGEEQYAPIDALTAHHWIGAAWMRPLTNVMIKSGRGAFVVVKTSFNPPSAVEALPTSNGRHMWEVVAEMVDNWGTNLTGPEYGFSNLGAVLGATRPNDATRMRTLMPNGFFLVPGYGAQGGGADGAVVGVHENGFGVLVNSSRAIHDAWKRNDIDPLQYTRAASDAARAARDDLTGALERINRRPW